MTSSNLFLPQFLHLLCGNNDTYSQDCCQTQVRRRAYGIWSRGRVSCFLPYSSSWKSLGCRSLSLPSSRRRRRREVSAGQLWKKLLTPCRVAPATSSPAMLILSQSCFIFRRAEIAKLVSILIYKMDWELRRGEGGDFIITIKCMEGNFMQRPNLFHFIGNKIKRNGLVLPQEKFK